MSAEERRFEIRLSADNAMTAAIVALAGAVKELTETLRPRGSEPAPPRSVAPACGRGGGERPIAVQMPYQG
jgi:hypothetical protein